MTGCNYYFGGKLIKNAGGYVSADRLGSIGKFYPYGQEKPSATANGTEKFTGYLRDAETGLDYADQRYEQPGAGRFMTPDPFAGSAAAGDPQSWNRYSYVVGDPINGVDRHGLYLDGTISVGNAPCPACKIYQDTRFTVIQGFTLSSGIALDYYISQALGIAMQIMNNALARDRQAAADAVARASDRIAGEDCASIFLPPDDNNPDGRVALSQDFLNYGANITNPNSAAIRMISPSQVSNYNPDVPAFTTGTSGFTYIVDGGGFFTGGPFRNVPAFNGLTTSQSQELILIHEFMHWKGMVGADDNGEPYTFADGKTVTGSQGISSEIRQHCFN